MDIINYILLQHLNILLNTNTQQTTHTHTQDTYTQHTHIYIHTHNPQTTTDTHNTHFHSKIPDGGDKNDSVKQDLITEQYLKMTRDHPVSQIIN